MKVINHEQRSEEWLEWRRSVLSASEAPAVMGENPWFPKTQYQLYQLHTGQKEVHFNQAMQAGNDNEARAIEVASKKIAEKVGRELNFEPMCAEREVEGLKLGASFDGFADGEVVEVKSVNPSSPAARKAGQGEVGHYKWQLVHQAIVAGVDRVWFFVYVIVHDDGFLIEFNVDDEDKKALIDAWREYQQCIENFEPPKLSTKDYEERDDEEWRELSDELLKLTAQKKEIDDKIKEIQERLKELADGQPSKGCGVTVYPVTRSGYDYKKLTEEASKFLDIDQFKKPASISWAVRVNGRR